MGYSWDTLDTVVIFKYIEYHLRLGFITGYFGILEDSYISRSDTLSNLCDDLIRFTCAQ